MLAARTGLSPVMVGRAVELARLRELAARVGDPAVVLVTGEAGIGKTRLVSELVATLDPSTPVLAGQGSQGAPGRPFQLLLEAVEPLVEAWDAAPERLAAREEPLRLLLGSVAPKLAPTPSANTARRSCSAPRSPWSANWRGIGPCWCSRTCTGPTRRASPVRPAGGHPRAAPAAGRDLPPGGRGPQAPAGGAAGRPGAPALGDHHRPRPPLPRGVAAVYRNRSWCVSVCRR